MSSNHDSSQRERAPSYASYSGVFSFCLYLLHSLFILLVIIVFSIKGLVDLFKKAVARTIGPLQPNLTSSFHIVIHSNFPAVPVKRSPWRNLENEYDLEGSLLKQVGRHHAQDDIYSFKTRASCTLARWLQAIEMKWTLDQFVEIINKNYFLSTVEHFFTTSVLGRPKNFRAGVLCASENFHSGGNVETNPRYQIENNFSQVKTRLSS